jgi:nucleoside-diphosphate-sugar epimerase
VTPGELVAALLRGRDETVAVTGATGWFGATAMDLLYGAFGDEAPERVVGYASTEREVAVADGRVAHVRPLTRLVHDGPVSTLLHFAYLTREKVAVLGVDRYVARNVAITSLVVDAISRLRPAQVVVTSSGAVHGPAGVPVSDVASDPYGALKRLDELTFRAAADEVGAMCVIPRVFSVAGPHMTHPDAYALGSMVAMARAGGPVEVRAQRPVLRSYCAVDEVVALCLWASFAGPSSLFDTGGVIVEIADLARAVVEVVGGGPVVRPVYDALAEPDRYVGDGSAMVRLCEQAGLRLRGLPELVAATAGPATR